MLNVSMNTYLIAILNICYQNIRINVTLKLFSIPPNLAVSGGYHSGAYTSVIPINVLDRCWYFPCQFYSISESSVSGKARLPVPFAL